MGDSITKIPPPMTAPAAAAESAPQDVASSSAGASASGAAAVAAVTPRRLPGEGTGTARPPVRRRLDFNAGLRAPDPFATAPTFSSGAVRDAAPASASADSERAAGLAEQLRAMQLSAGATHNPTTSVASATGTAPAGSLPPNLSLTHLPPDIQQELERHLDPESAKRMREVSREFAQIGTYRFHKLGVDPERLMAGAGLQEQILTRMLVKLAGIGSLDLSTTGVAQARKIQDARHTDAVLADIGDAELREIVVQCLAAGTTVVNVDLTGRNAVTAAGLAALGSLKQLQTLKLANCTRVDNAGVAGLASLVNLQALDLSSCDRVTGAGLAPLRGMVAMQRLVLSGCAKVDDLGLAHLEGMARLEQLDLSKCLRVTDAGVGHLAGLHQLKSLNLQWCAQVGDTGLGHLQSLKGLQALNLSSCIAVTDAGVGRLVALPHLESLNLSGCRALTDVSVAHLNQMPALRHLNLSGCDGISPAAIGTLMATIAQHS